jgi:hypothetical protein
MKAFSWDSDDRVQAWIDKLMKDFEAIDGSPSWHQGLPKLPEIQTPLVISLTLYTLFWRVLMY